MLLYQLVRKDLLLVRNLVPFALLALGVIPVLTNVLSASMPLPLPAAIPLAYMVVLGEIIILQMIAQEEAKRPKTQALLCTAPFPRKTVVYARYVLFYLIFSYCLVAHTVVMLLMGTDLLTLTSILVVMLAGAIVFAIYTPLELKYGLVKAKLIFMFVILLFSMGPALASKLLENIHIDLSFLTAIAPGAKNLTLMVANIVVMAISLRASLRIFSIKEL